MNNELKITRKEYIEILDNYFKEIGRDNPPPYKTYKLAELKKMLLLFNISVKKISDVS
jgi:hypothetical protein